MTFPHLRLCLRALAAVAFACLLVTPAFADDDDNAPAPHGPATLEFRTLHMYRESITGGVEEIVLRRGSRADLTKIRGMLHADYLQWSQATFSDPKLHRAARAIRARFDEVPTGAEIVFTSNDPQAVAALHAWFAAQVRAERAKHPSGGPGVGA
jgi:hypothetical protein